MTKKIFSEYLQTALGAFILALGIYVFFMPHNLIVGGVSGLGIILLHYSENWAFTIPVWLTNLTVNIPLLLIALKIIGTKFIAKTVFATFFLSFSLFLLEEYMPFIVIETDLFLAAVIGGVVCGIGVGIVYRQLATTGGSVLIATLIHKVVPHIPMQRAMMIIDWSIILLGYFVFGPERTMYAIIAIFICSKAIEYVLEGLHFAKAAFIISEDSESIAKAINEQMGRGITSLSGRGTYTGNEKNVLMCVVSRREIVRVKEIVSNIDERAFVIVADVREVLGEGFKDFDNKL